MTLDEIEKVFSSGLWKNIEIANLSGGEPTTRNDLVDISRRHARPLPRLRKFGINTTGLTPHRAIPMLTKIVELCHERDIIFSARVSIDGIGEMHNEVRQVKRGFEKANETIRAMQALQKRYRFNFGISTTHLPQEPRRRREHPGVGEDRRTSTSSSTWCASPTRCSATASSPRRCRPSGRRRRAHAPVLPRSRPDGLAARRPELHLHALRRHDRQRLSPPGAVPVPDAGHHAQPGRRPVLLREQRSGRQRPRHAIPKSSISAPRARRTATSIRDEKCPTCLSPCQMNVAAVKQVAPYAKFLVTGRARETPLPQRESGRAGRYAVARSMLRL